VTGEPGVGKTRLAQDFLRSRGPWLHLPSHPGDRDVPFASAARNARARLAAARNVELPDWVRRELSRLLPELHGAEDLPPLMADTDRRTFFLAHLEMARRTSSAYVATLNDDVHDYDAATIDLGAFLFAHAAAQDGPGTMPRFVSVYRLGELSAAQQTAVDRLVDTGVAVRVTLTPWDRGDVVTLLRDLPLPPGVSEQSAVDELAARLHASSGGNPQFVLEAVRHLLETGDEFLSVPNGDPGSFAALVQRRLARLSSRALHAARAAAVLGSDFTLEHVSDVLGLPIVDTAGAWEELDAAQIVVGESFGHDLVAQAVLTGTPDPTRRLLHRAAARVLLQYGAPPARVARHWQQGGDDRQSAEWWIGAARAAEATLRPVEAAEFLEHAANAFETSGQPERAEEARRERARILHSEAAGA